MRLKVAVLEDDVALREDILVPQLAHNGFDVEGFGSSAELYRRMVAVPFEMLLLDLRLPDEDGLEVARYLRKVSPTGIVMLTGSATQTERIRGLTEVVDAWLTKPVDIDVLAATLHSVARRLRPDAPAIRNAGAAEWRLSASGWRLYAPDERSVQLNLMERQLLTQLFAAAGEPVGHDELIGGLAASAENFDRHRLEILIHRLRRKVESRLGIPVPLRAVRGIGYLMLAVDEREHSG